MSALVIFIMVPVPALLAAIAIPNFMKTRQDAFRRIGPVSVDTGMSAERAAQQGGEKAQGAPQSILTGNRDVYKVRLKNGMVFEAQIEKEGANFYVFRAGNGTFDAAKSEIEEMKKIE